MSSNKTLVINCGASHVAAAFFSAQNGSLSLEALDSRDLRYDGTDEKWLPAVLEALRDLSRSNPKIRGKAVFILPGYQVFTKTIKVPHVEASKQAQIIAFEAQNNMPFPLAEVVWGSQIISDDGIETEVVLIALKSDQANRFCTAAGMIGFEPIALQPASLLDYNAYKLVHNADAEDTVMVNIGARSTNLTFISKDGFYVRNVNIGGNTFTQMVADTAGKTFAQAEDVKVSFYSGQANFDADDPAAAILLGRAPEFMKRLSQQLTQSIIAYRRATNRPAPVRILLTGRGGLLHGLPEYLSENQKVSVDYFNPSPVITLKGVAPDVMERYYYQVSEITGEAYRLVGKDAVGVNLLPENIRKRLQFEKQKPFLVAAAACLLLAPAPMLAHYQQEASVAQGEVTELNQKAGALKGVHTNIEQLSKTATDTRGQIANFEGLINSRGNWILFFADLQKLLVNVKDIWLDSLEVERKPPPETPKAAAASVITRPGAPATPAADAAPAAPAALPSYRLHIRGRMLLRAYDPSNPGGSRIEEAQNRVSDLINNFNNMPFVKEVEKDSIRLDATTDRRLLGFDFWLQIKPEQPL